MKPHHARPRIGGFTVIEGLVCVVVVFILMGLYLPTLAKSGSSKRITCVNYLKQIGLSFHMWSNDHGEKFPWDISSESPNGGGTKEFTATGEVWRHFQAISNELNTPKILACPNDKERTRTLDFSALNNSHLSYFIGLNANEVYPQAILSGDRNLAISNKLVKSVVTMTPSTNPEWTTSIHNKSGNLALADGSATQLTQQMLNKQLQAAFLSTTQAALRFVFPQ